ncbi:hypothetical protein OH492_23220 [Vibrio chagasii]|nr:hypothetical protein [Vibrio chagasii]
MGDVGSLALGGALGVIAACSSRVGNSDGGVFVMETCCNPASRLTKLRPAYFPLRAAPIYHHYELKGCFQNRVYRAPDHSTVLVPIGRRH